MHRPAARLRAPDPSAARQSPTTLPPDDPRIVPAPAAGSRRLWRRSIRTVAASLCKRVAVDVASVAKRARTENFPVASLLFPRRLRPHLRAVYGFARLLDIRRDEVEGNRLAALDELEREVDACYAGEPAWPVMRVLQPTIREFSLEREPFLRLIEANRMDQRIVEYRSWDDLKEYCRHSADPVGRLVLGLLQLDREPELVAASDNVCTGLQLVNFLQDVPRDLELGRVYLPAEDRRRFGDPALDRPSEELRALLRFEAVRADALLRRGDVLRARIGGRLGRAVGLFARGGLAAVAALDAPPAEAMHVALSDARARYAIPHSALEALVEGGLQDLEQATYASFDELRGYCEKVAGAVGVACVAVYGSDDVERAMTLGIALQLINIMRDVAEDEALGRVYLPQDELARFGVTRLAPTEEFRELMAFQAAR